MRTAHLQLVHDVTGKAIVGPRPFLTHYYDPNSRAHDWKAVGRAKTVEGAIIAAVRRVLDGRASSAIIHDESGVVVRRVLTRPTGIMILGE